MKAKTDSLREAKLKRNRNVSVQAGIVLILGLLQATTFSRLDAQPISVSLQVSERTPGLIESAIASALRGLGDVAVVGRQEPADFVLQVAAACWPDCERTSDYSIAVLFSEQLTAEEVDGWFSNVPEDELRDLGELGFFGAYLEPHQLLALKWGRDRVETGARELIAEIDRRCFERQRILKRHGEHRAAGDSAAATALLQRFFGLGEDWLC